MKKNFIGLSIALFLLSIMCGCTPKATSVWCEGINNSAKFSFEYVVTNSVYDGESRSFSVKSEKEFESFLTQIDEFDGLIQKVDSKDVAFIFLKDGEKYFCSKIGGNRYKLSACRLTIYDSKNDNAYFFSFPPTSSLNFDNENKSISTVQSWDYFKLFYHGYSDVEIAEETKQIITSFFLDGEKAGNLVLTYKEGSISYEFNLKDV